MVHNPAFVNFADFDAGYDVGMQNYALPLLLVMGHVYKHIEGDFVIF